MNKIKRKEELSRLTTGGTSAAVASKSQRTPLQTKTHQWIKKTTGSENHNQTCLQRTCARPKVLPRRRRRNSPTSITRSKDTSVTSMETRLCGSFRRWSPIQVTWVFNQTARIYRWNSTDVSKSWKFVIHLHGGCHRTALVKCFQVTTGNERRDLPWMRNPTLTHHTMIAPALTALCLFQMATLAIPMSS